MATVEQVREIVGGDGAALAELEALYAATPDGLQTEAVLEFAKGPATALHSHFEWDDAKAGHQWRLSQARQLIQSYNLHVVEDGKERQLRYFTNVVVNDEHVYRKTEDVLKIDGLREQARLRLIRDMNRIRREMANWKEFEEAAGIVESAVAALKEA